MQLCCAGDPGEHALEHFGVHADGGGQIDLAVLDHHLSVFVTDGAQVGKRDAVVNIGEDLVNRACAVHGQRSISQRKFLVIVRALKGRNLKGVMVEYCAVFVEINIECAGAAGDDEGYRAVKILGHRGALGLFAANENDTVVVQRNARFCTCYMERKSHAAALAVDSQLIGGIREKLTEHARDAAICDVAAVCDLLGCLVCFFQYRIQIRAPLRCGDKIL